ncbi:MAG: TonB-dependent receptor [Cyclonatronaceae bacterium]
MEPKLFPRSFRPTGHSTALPAGSIPALTACLVLLAGLTLIRPAHAQSQSDTLYRVLDEIEVTATKNVRTLTEVPGRVGVVSAEEMSLTPAATLVDILRSVSGVNTSSSLGFFTMRPNVTVRGLSGEEQSRTLVLIDGAPTNNSDTGGVNWNSISTANVEQVEIYKGPGSSLFGSNAMGGVINIITRTPTEPLLASAGISYGSFNTLRSNLSLTNRATDRLTLHVHGFYNNSDGYNPVPESERDDFSVPRNVEDAGATARLAWAFSDLAELTASYDYFANNRGEGTIIEEPGMYRKFDMNRARLGLKGQRNDFRYALNMFFQREDYFRVSERLRGDSYSRFNVESDRDDMGITLDLFQDVSSSHWLALGSNHSLTGGLEFKLGSVDGGDFYQTSDDVVINRGKMRFFAGYLQDEISLLDRQMHLLLGLRYDHATFFDGYFRSTEGVLFRGSPLANYNDDRIVSNSWSTLSPRIALRYSPSRAISGYVSYARGFRASILDDLSRTGIFRGRIKIANPELRPETLDNYEAGLDLRPVWRLSISPTVFYSRGNDFLYFVARELEDGSDVWRRENVSSVGLTGAELDLRYFASDALTLSASYTRYHSEILSFPEHAELEGMELTYSPRNQASASVQWQNPLADLGLSFYYKGSQFSSDDNNTSNDGTPEIDAYTTLDLMVSRRFFDALTASVEVLDVMDNRFMETVDYMSPGRMVNIRLNYDFSR